MQIIDINGQMITVTDLDKALEEAEMFKDFRHESDAFKNTDEQRQKYWRDICRKLLHFKDSNKAG